MKPLTLSLSKGLGWFDKLTMSGTGKPPPPAPIPGGEG